MSDQSEHKPMGYKLTGILGAILIVAEIPIRLLEHTHLLEGLEQSAPSWYALVVSSRAAVVRWVVGILMILWVIYELRQHEPSDTSAQQKSSNSRASVSATPSHAITIAPIFNNNNSANVERIPAADVARRSMAALPRQPAPARIGPNLIFLRTQVIPVTFNNYDGLQSFSQSREIDRGDLRAVLACFRNEPTDRRIVNAGGVRAQVIYKNQEGHEIGLGIPSAYWLDEDMDVVNFRGGDSRCAVLLIVMADGQLYTPWKRRAQSREGYGEVVNHADSLLEEPVSIIEIRILGSENELLVRKIFDFAINN